MGHRQEGFDYCMGITGNTRSASTQAGFAHVAKGVDAEYWQQLDSVTVTDWFDR